MKKIIKTIVKDKLLLGLTVSLIVIFGVSASLLVVRAGNFLFSNDIKAIDFSNLTIDEIEEWYVSSFGAENGLRFYEEYSEEVAEGKIISQKPEANESVNLDIGLTITVSKGKDPNKTFNLPDFVKEEYTKDEIEKYFEENAFSNITYEYQVVEDDTAKDVVISINRNGTVKRGDMIIVTLSAGSEGNLVEVKVPNFSSYTTSTAQSWGNSNSITIRFEYVYSNSYASGKIIAQSVDPDETVSSGSTITLTVSKGKGITVSNIVGRTLAQAREYAEDNGFKLSIQYEYSDTIEEGYITRTSPAAGSLLGSGDTLTIYISEGVNPDNVKVEVESYVGKSESELQSYINGLGLDYQKETSIYSDTVAKDLVAYHTTGTVTKATKIEYALSLGSYTINLSDFNGKSLSSAQSVVNSANNLNANIRFTYSEEVNNSYSENTLFGCSISGKNISCKLAKKGDTSSEKPSSGDEIYIESNYGSYQGNSVDETEALLRRAFPSKNLNITKQSSNKAAGVILSMTINDNQSYTKGFYPADTIINVVISTGYLN